MRFTTCGLASIFVLTFSLCVFAQKDESSQSKFEANAVARLLNEAHDSLHSHGEKTTFRSYIWDWLKTFDLKGFAHGTHRFLNVKLQNPEYRDHALNLAMLLPMSHLTEMAAGPAAVYTAHSMELSTGIQVAIGAAGGLITLPGLDPLCLLFLSSYKLEPVQKGLTQSRLAIYKVSQAAARTFGLNRIAESLFLKQSALDRMFASFQNGIPLKFETLSEDQVLERTITRVTYYDPTTLEAHVSIDVVREMSAVKDEHVTYISGLKVYQKISNSNLKQLKSWMSDLGWNARSAIIDTISELQKNGPLESQYHIENLDRESGSATFRPFTLLLRDKTRLRTCDDHLAPEA